MTISFTPISGVGGSGVSSSGVAYAPDDGGLFWNPSDKGAVISLSENNLLATATGAWDSVRAAVSRFSGKRYFEVEAVQLGSGNLMLGVGNSSALLTNYLGNTANSWGWQMASSLKWNNNVSASYGAAGGYSSANGDRISVLMNFDAGELSFWGNGIDQGVAFTGLTGTLFPMLAANTNGSGRAKFNSGDWLYTPPTGYSTW